ncbi:MAG TPA: serine hydrolase domain-containing protein, partial [Vicinamibacterales bacterium]|nr:serine hydrolase domain-containing protein [Vicinamibacterales bacterium]
MTRWTVAFAACLAALFQPAGVLDAGRLPLPLSVPPAGTTSQTAMPSAAIDRLVEQAMADQRIPGLAVAIVGRGDVVLLRGYGLSNLEHRTPVTPETMFQSGSLGKQLTAAGVMALVEDGRVNLDASIRTYLPATPESWQPITIRHLLSHSSGLAYGFASDTVTALNAAGVNGADVPLLYDPGEAWSYAGGIAIVGRVLEEIEGIGLDEFLGQRLFEPLGMTDTSFAVPTVKNERVTTTHGRDDTGALIENPNADEIRSAPSGKARARAGLGSSWSETRTSPSWLRPSSATLSGRSSLWPSGATPSF